MWKAIKAYIKFANRLHDIGKCVHFYDNGDLDPKSYEIGRQRGFNKYEIDEAAETKRDLSVW